LEWREILNPTYEGSSPSKVKKQRCQQMSIYQANLKEPRAIQKQKPKLMTQQKNTSNHGSKPRAKLNRNSLRPNLQLVMQKVTMRKATCPATILMPRIQYLTWLAQQPKTLRPPPQHHLKAQTPLKLKLMLDLDLESWQDRLW
jgi:hypothetical protein